MSLINLKTLSELKNASIPELASLAKAGNKQALQEMLKLCKAKRR